MPWVPPRLSALRRTGRRFLGRRRSTFLGRSLAAATAGCFGQSLDGDTSEVLNLLEKFDQLFHGSASHISLCATSPVSWTVRVASRAVVVSYGEWNHSGREGSTSAPVIG